MVGLIYFHVECLYLVGVYQVVCLFSLWCAYALYVIRRVTQQVSSSRKSSSFPFLTHSSVKLMPTHISIKPILLSTFQYTVQPIIYTRLLLKHEANIEWLGDCADTSGFRILRCRFHYQSKESYLLH